MDCYDSLIGKCKPKTTTRLNSALVALFTSSGGGPLIYSNKIGVLHLDIDRSIKTFFLRLYDLDTVCLLFAVQLYYGFDQAYRSITKTLYAFDYWEKGIIAFKFRNEEEAELMHEKIQSLAPKMEQFIEIQKLKLEARQKQEMGKHKSLFDRMMDKISKKPQVIEQEASKVISVKKTKSITVDEEGRMSSDNVPCEWEEVFTIMGSNTDKHQKNFKKPILADKKVHSCLKENQASHEPPANEAQNTGQQNRKEEVSPAQQYLIPPILNILPPEPPSLPSLPSHPLIPSYNRECLMDEIRKNDLKLKPVPAKQSLPEPELIEYRQVSNEPMNFADHLRVKIQMRSRMGIFQDDSD